MKVSIRDLSKMTGFSPATISNALNHKKGVNRETAEEIFRVARETGYLSANAVTKIRLVVFKKNGQILEETPFFQLMIEGIEEECHRLGYEMVMSHVDQRNPNYLKHSAWNRDDGWRSGALQECTVSDPAAGSLDGTYGF